MKACKVSLIIGILNFIAAAFFLSFDDLSFIDGLVCMLNILAAVWNITDGVGFSK